MSSKEVSSSDCIRLDKRKLCQKYSHYRELSEVCPQSGAATGNVIDHIIELQMIVKALKDDMTPQYTRDTWLEDLREVSNNVKNLQELSTRENQDKNQAIRMWLDNYWPLKSAKKCLGANNTWVRQMKTAWKNLKPEFEKKFPGLAQTIDKMILG